MEQSLPSVTQLRGPFEEGSYILKRRDFPPAPS